MDKIFNYGDLRPYFQIAEWKATDSPCVRRKYGALIAYADITENPLWVVETNSRLARCCDGKCVRDTFKFTNGERVEMGAEIHAETAALIAAKNKGDLFVLVGQTANSPLYGENVYPCHACALAIKFAGYKHIHIKTAKDVIQAVSIDAIIEHRELEWEPDN